MDDLAVGRYDIYNTFQLSMVNIFNFYCKLYGVIL